MLLLNTESRALVSHRMQTRQTALKLKRGRLDLEIIIDHNLDVGMAMAVNKDTTNKTTMFIVKIGAMITIIKVRSTPLVHRVEEIVVESIRNRPMLPLMAYKHLAIISEEPAALMVVIEDTKKMSLSINHQQNMKNLNLMMTMRTMIKILKMKSFFLQSNPI